MKVLVLVALLSLSVALATEAECPNCFLKHSGGLSASRKNDIFATNIHHVEKLDLFPNKCIVDFLKELNLHDTTIKLGHVIRGGHSVHYQFVEGKNPALVKQVALKHHLQVYPLPLSSECKCNDCCGRLVLPSKEPVQIVDAVEVPGKRQLRANMPKSGGTPPYPVPREKSVGLQNLNQVKPHSMLTQQQEDKQRTKYLKLDDTQKQWYRDNNIAQMTKMNTLAQPFIRKFLDDMQEHAKNTVIHLMTPILDGFSVRFTMVEGSKADVLRFANQCGVTLQGRTLIAPRGQPKSAEATLESDGKSHIVTESEDQTDAGWNKPVAVADKSKRQIVSALPDKWIETKPAFVESDSDADALIAEPMKEHHQHHHRQHQHEHEPHQRHKAHRQQHQHEPKQHHDMEMPMNHKSDDDDDAFLRQH